MLSPESSADPGQWVTARAEYQRGIMDAFSEPGIDRVVVMASSQVGKALALDTPLPTPTGWTTMAAVQAGDWLLDETGFPCRVTALSPVQVDRDCYRVRFGDGSEIVADGEHRWYVEGSQARGGKAAVMTTRELLADLHTKKGDSLASNWAVPVAAALNLPEVTTDIPPYVLGLWLGDGNTHAACLTAGDEDVIELAGLIEREGVEVDSKAHPGGWRLLLDRRSDGSYCRGYQSRAEYNRAYYRQERHGEPMNVIERRPSMFARLTALGVIGAKFIPPQYLRGSYDQRLALLQGLMDSDGYAQPNGICEFISTDAGLAAGVFELAASLGLKPRTAEGRATLKGVDCGPKYRVTFVAYAETPVFRLRRKLARLRSADQKGLRPTETRRRFIRAIEKVESVPVKCVAVDSPSHLYLAGRAMIPTHNTEILLNVAGFHMHQDPCPVLVVQPTDLMGETWSKDRLEPMIRDTPVLTDRVARARDRDSGTTLTHKRFIGGHLTVIGSNSPSNLASRPIRLVLIDELDRWPVSAGKEGDPLQLVLRRTQRFWNRRIGIVSTPTRKGYSRIESEYEKTDQRKYHVACPHCAHSQTFKWSSVRWPDKRPTEACYHCEACGAGWSEAERRAAIRWGRWIATAVGERNYAGFHLSELCSPAADLGAIATEFLNAKRSVETLKVFVNTVLGESFEEDAERVDHSILEARSRAEPAEAAAGADPRILVVTAGVDVQANRLECERVGWGVAEESWSLDHVVFPGDPNRPEVWKKLDEYLLTPTIRADGASLPIATCCVDSGFATQAVYKFCMPRFKRRVFAIKGMSGSGRQMWPREATKIKETKTKKSARVFILGIDAAKDAIYAHLKVETEGEPGYCHFPPGRGPAYFAQLTAEEVRTKYVRGFPVRVYHLPDHKRNEALDLRVYAYAALQSLDVKWGRVVQKDRRRTTVLPEAEPPPATVKAPDRIDTDETVALGPRPPAPQPQRQAAQPRRKIRRSAWMT